MTYLKIKIINCIIDVGQEVASYWYSAVRQYNYFKEPDVLHANVNAGEVLDIFSLHFVTTSLLSFHK